MLARAADEEQHDAVDVVVLAGPAAFARVQAGERQAERGEGAGVEEVAAGQAVAEGSRAVGVQSDHELFPGKIGRIGASRNAFS